MQLQQIVVKESEYPSLYFRGGKQQGGQIILDEGERLSFDTYFNSFTYTKYRDYTRVDTVDFRADISGKAEVMLCCFDGEREEIVVSTHAEGAFVLSVRLAELPKRAFLYPVIIAESTVTFVGGEYTAEVEASPVSFAIAICTYKREEYLKKNLALLEAAAPHRIDNIIVVDNGNTLDPKEELGSKVRIFKNPNYGGSAGFTRGIIEARRAGASHVILMDDDIEIFPETLARMSAFAAVLTEEYKNAHLSAAMLPTSAICYQYEKGALWNGAHIQSLNSGLDVREREALIANLDDGPIAYGAWWCFAMPISDVDAFGLPLPLFIKFDDVEYGTRCCKNAPIITMSGMAVAHADFDGKYNMHLEYYTVRNQLIMLAVHKMQGTLGCIFRLMKVSAKHLFLYRYEAMPIILRAFHDFLRGAEFIINENAEELNRSVMAMSPPAISLGLLPEWNGSIKESYVHKKDSAARMLVRIITLGGHIIPRALMKKETVYAPLPGVKDVDCFMHGHTVQYQVLGDGGYVFDKHSGKFFREFGRCIGMMFKIIFRYRKAAESYREYSKYLMSEEFWKRYLGID